MLQGDKVKLRPVHRADIDGLLRWINTAEVMQYVGRHLPMTEMAEEKFIEEMGDPGAHPSDIILIIEAAEGDGWKPIGSIGLHRINWIDVRAEFGIMIGEKEYWSNGFGSEAARLIIRYGFEQLNLHRLTSKVFAFNERSLAMHRKVGFIEEGRMKEYIFKNGAYHDCVLFGLLRDGWAGAG